MISNLEYKIWAHRPWIKGTIALFIVIKAIIIIWWRMHQRRSFRTLDIENLFVFSFLPLPPSPRTGPQPHSPLHCVRAVFFKRDSTAIGRKVAEDGIQTLAFEERGALIRRLGSTRPPPSDPWLALSACHRRQPLQDQQFFRGFFLLLSTFHFYFVDPASTFPGP